LFNAGNTGYAGVVFCV